MLGNINQDQVMRACTTRGCIEAAGTCARGRVWLPEIPAADLSADNSFGPLQDVAWITLEDHLVPRLPAVPAAGPVSRQARVVTGGRSGDCRNTFSA